MYNIYSTYHFLSSITTHLLLKQCSHSFDCRCDQNGRRCMVASKIVVVLARLLVFNKDIE